MENNVFLFVYGFLMRQFHGSRKTNTPQMDVEFISEGTIVGSLYRVDSYPGVVLNPGGNKVYGEIFQLKEPDDLSRVLDEYEHAFPLIKTGFDYRRIRTTAKTGSGDFECWVYEYAKPVDGLEQIASGRFEIQEP